MQYVFIQLYYELCIQHKFAEYNLRYQLPLLVNDAHILITAIVNAHSFKVFGPYIKQNI